ncbi:FAD binding domain protein [Thozetella sp. PMI_491]|nr:FAD binding domain protein [Thozetella sp. PMI_491]
MLRPAFTLVILRMVAAKQALAGCKITPSDREWPLLSEWASLNASIDGALLKTAPAASSCYPGNPFGSALPCAYVENNWAYSDFHENLPESVDYPIFANNSCLPPNATGYLPRKGCTIGGLPEFIVNATSEGQIATAMKWAAKRNIRIVVKGTGHDLSGRSTGAYSLSIWTHHLDDLELQPAWPLPGSKTNQHTEHVLIAGSGNDWGRAVRHALSVGRIVVSSQDETVGLGGHIQGGGHGPLSSTYGLAADQVLQVRFVTPGGTLLVADATQNQEILWAVRGGGAGQYGIVTQYILRTYPAPKNVVSTTMTVSIVSQNGSELNPSPGAADASWLSVASLMRDIPDLMDEGLSGVGYIISAGSGTGVSASFSFQAYNATPEWLDKVLEPVAVRMANNTSHVVIQIAPAVIYNTFLAYFESINPGRSPASGVGYITSRLLGRPHLSELSTPAVSLWLQRLANPTAAAQGFSQTIINLVAGPGPRHVEQGMRGALNPVWRETYVHAITLSANVDYDSMTPKAALEELASWTEANLEPVWREWAPSTGAYMNEGNPRSSQFKYDFYGVNYDRLVEIKRKYDPTGSLYRLAGVDTNGDEYDLTTGKLCY